MSTQASIPYPRALDVTESCIPSSLTQCPRWVAWHWVQVYRRWTKVPLSPSTGGTASVTNADTWADFETALHYARSHHHAGVGVVLIGDGLMGWDLDHAVDPATNQPELWAAEIINSLNSYAELSPSGTGVRIFLKADLCPDGRKRHGHIECYDRGRYLTVTGHALPGVPQDVEARQTEHDEVYRRILGVVSQPPPSISSVWTGISSKRNSQLNRLRMRRQTLDLLDSSGPAGYGSASEADAAIAAGLCGAGLTADEALDALASSARGQDALRRKGRHGEAYLRRTIEHAAQFVGPTILRPDGRLVQQRFVRRHPAVTTLPKRPGVGA